MSNAMFTCVVVVLCWLPLSHGAKPIVVNSDPANNRDFVFPTETDDPSGHHPHNHYHSHHHSPDLHDHHHHEHGLEDAGTEGYPKVEEPGNIDPNVSMQIPLDFIQNINDLDVDDLLQKYVEGAELDKIGLSERFDDEVGQPRKNGFTPNKAGCIPELRTVKIVESTDPSILYIPQCTRIERCGGCCSHSLLSCQPVEVETLNFEVFKTQFTGGKKLKALGKEIVVAEKHIKCKCDCRLKPEDCSKFQEYRKSECQCVCANKDEERKCNKNSARKLWNPNLCECQCRETVRCSTGSYFDQNECACKMRPFSQSTDTKYLRLLENNARAVAPLSGGYKFYVRDELF